MKLDDLIYDGIENTLDERLLEYADLRLYEPCRRDIKCHGSSLSDE